MTTHTVNLTPKDGVATTLIDQDHRDNKVDDGETVMINYIQSFQNMRVPFIISPSLTQCKQLPQTLTKVQVYTTRMSTPNTIILLTILYQSHCTHPEPLLSVVSIIRQ